MRCLPTDSPPSKAAINSCRERLAEEVLAYPRSLILALGNSAARSFLGDHNFKMTSRRGHPIDLEEIGVFLPTFHPASILRNNGEYPRWAEDIKYAASILGGGSKAIKKPPKSTAYVLLADPDEAVLYHRARTATTRAGQVKEVGEDALIPWRADYCDPQVERLADWPAVKVVTGIPAAVRTVDLLLQRKKLSADIETGFSYSPRLGKVLALSVAWSQTEAVVFGEGLLGSRSFRPYLKKLLTSLGPLWIGHNWKWDSPYLRHQFFDAEWPDVGALVPAKPYAAKDGYHDTLLEHYCLDESKGTHDLESLARDLLGAEDYKYVVRKYGRGDLGYENVPREVLYPYAALDTTHTFAIHEMLCDRVHADKGLSKLYNHLLLRGSAFLQKVQDYGLWVDQDFVARLDEQLSKKIADAEAVLQVEVSRKLKLFPLSRSNGRKDFGPLWDPDVYMQSQWATKKQPTSFNPGNWRHTAFCLYRLIGWVPMNTNERTLRDLDQTGRDQSATFGYKAKNYARGHPNRKQTLNYSFIQALIDVRLARHAYRMLVTGTRKYLEPDGRMHTNFNLTATETGRLSSTNPNLQNLPVPEKDDPEPARNIVGAPPGRVLIEADYSQVELRLLAHFSKDDNLLEVYREGRDLHTELSIAIWGDRVYDEAGRQVGGYTNYQRVRAKAVNFGIAYGRGASSIAAEHDIPEEEAEEMRQAWFERFPQAAAWLSKLHQSPFKGRTVVSPFGRRRRFGVVSRDNYHDLKNQSANFPMQSTASDLNLFSAMRAQDKWDYEGTDAHIICLVHDAVVAECPEEIADRVAKELGDIMSDTPKRVLNPTVEFPVDVHIGRRWGTLKLEEMTVEKKVIAEVGAFGKTGVASGKL